MTRIKVAVLITILLTLVTFGGANASLVEYVNSGGLTLAVYTEVSLGGGSTTLNGSVPDYHWWYGCSPTSAGMLAGYYDINGYNGYTYSRLVKGVIAETSTYGAGTFAVNSIIASSGHVADFYGGGLGASGDDTYDGRNFDCLADFMGTSQDSAGNTNGGTTFYFNPSGAKLYMGSLSASYRDKSGAYGIWEYFNYSGYNQSGPGQNFYNQYIAGFDGNLLGFTFQDYMNEIDNSRAVILHIENHSLFGYGYDAGTGEILFHDTWSLGEHRMLWGDSYDGRDLFGVTVVIPDGGSPVPLPAAFWFLGSGLLALIGLKRMH